MRYSFLIDAQLPSAVCALFQELGHGAEHVGTVLAGSAADTAVARYAAAKEACIVTRDRDFVALQRLHRFPALIWVRSGNMRRSVLVPYLNRQIPLVIAALDAGEVLVELR